MVSFNVQDIGIAVHALNNLEEWAEQEVTSVGFDTRKLSEGALFVPLQGQHDGHDYVENAIENGARATLWSRPLEEAPKHIPVIQVEDTLQALQDLAAYHLQKVGPKVVGITGSNGKTTTKDMTEAVLSSRYRVHKTQGNFNNHIGLPITLLEMPRDTEVVILEMGMSGAGEIKVLSDLAKPDVAVITMIGEAHIGYLGSRAGIADAKMEIVSGLKKTGVLIYPGEEELLTERVQSLAANQKKTFGTKESNDMYPVKIESRMKETRFRTNIESGIGLSIPVLGTYNVNNALAALLVGLTLDVSIAEAAPRLASFRLTKNRTEWLEGFNGCSILNDSYNASPTAMKLVLENFSKLEVDGEKVAVLGDMLELGDHSAQLHTSVKEALDPNLVNEVVLYGPQMKNLYEALQGTYQAENIHHFEGDKAPLIDYLKKQVDPKDYVLVKSSLGTDLLSVVKAIQS